MIYKILPTRYFIQRPALLIWLITVLTALLLITLSCQAPVSTTPPKSPEQPPTVPVSPPVSTPQQPAVWKADGIISAGEYNKSKTYGDFEVYCTSDDHYAYFALKAKTTGWVAIGFDPESLMKNADIIEGIVSDGKVTVLDMFSTGDFGPHPPDIQQGGTNDILKSGGTEESGFTVIEFKRKIDTGDKFDKVLDKGTHKIIWAFGSDDQATVKHSGRGVGEIDF